MTEKKNNKPIFIIILLASIIPIAIILLIDNCGNRQANQYWNDVIKASGQDFHIDNRSSIKGYVGKNSHPASIREYGVNSHGDSSTVAAFSCSDIDSAQVWLLYPKGNEKKLKGAKYRLDVDDDSFKGAFDVYCSSVEYAKQVFTPEIRQKLLDNKEPVFRGSSGHQGSWGLVRSRLTFIKTGHIRPDIDRMVKTINIGEVLIERMHDIADQ